MHQTFEDLMGIEAVERRTAIVYDDGYLRHETGAHPETSKRLERIKALVSEDPIWREVVLLKPRKATVAEVEYIHSLEYIRSIESACQQGMRFLDADTIISPDSYWVALLAVGGVLTAIDAVMDGLADNALALVRPPGHHAEPERAMGFCLFNNVAIGARYAQKKYNLERVAIIDWDVHHGNGTQKAFYSDPSVLYISLHQYPLFPGTGSRVEEGVGQGRGFTLNIPMSPGGGDIEYMTAFQEQVLPRLDAFNPQLLLISAGFDAHMDDPLASMNLTNQGFNKMAQLLIHVAHKTCQDRLVSVLEGGYSLSSLPYTVLDHIYALSGAQVIPMGHS
jgi:acetoin utilization deacetylase AcuC-like enzyme